MKVTDYYEILGIPVNASIEEIKRAYRKKACLYHPDLNSAPDAKDLFISATEAYEFLISNHELIMSENLEYNQAMEDWRKYRQDKSRKRAKAYSRTSYENFRNTRFYKTTRFFDRTTLIISFLISAMVLVFTVYGFIFRLKHPLPGLEKPSVFAFIMLLLLGILFFTVSCVFLKVHHDNTKKHKR